MKKYSVLIQEKIATFLCTFFHYFSLHTLLVCFVYTFSLIWWVFCVCLWYCQNISNKYDCTFDHFHNYVNAIRTFRPMATRRLSTPQKRQTEQWISLNQGTETGLFLTYKQSLEYALYVVDLILYRLPCLKLDKWGVLI